ncbi:MAG: M28 family peptidase [Byssovorax sp.]
MTSRWPLLAALYGLVALLVVAVAITAAPPDVVSADAPASEFSGARALATVHELTATELPHPPGSADHARVQGVVVDRLRALGLAPELQPARECGRGGCVDIVNIVARIPGAEPGPAVLLAAHYDSVPAGPGAGDDGAGTAAVIEIARALLAEGTPRRSVIVLLDDGEELGLFGARAFVRAHPWAAEVGVALNFEARGTGGQTAMFETSERSADLVEAYGRAAKRPVASSVIYTLYKQLPNDTDLTVFKAAGMRGLNFAFADRVWEYHTPRDTADALDPRSLQHMGDQGLAAARAILAQGSSRAGSDESVYFDLFARTLVIYRARWVRPLAIAAALLAAAALGFAVRRKRASILGIAAAAGLALGTLVVAGLAGVAVSTLIGALRGPLLPWSPAPTGPWVAFVAAGVAAATALGAVVPKLCSLTRLGGVLALWTALALLVSFTAPGASYLFVLPTFALGAALLAAVRSARDAAAPGSLVSLAPVALTALLWFPLLRILLVMVGAGVSPTATVPAALVAMTAMPLLGSFSGRLRWATPLTAGAVVAVLLLL